MEARKVSLWCYDGKQILTFDSNNWQRRRPRRFFFFFLIALTSGDHKWLKLNTWDQSDLGRCRCGTATPEKSGIIDTPHRKPSAQHSKRLLLEGWTIQQSLHFLHFPLRKSVNAPVTDLDFWESSASWMVDTVDGFALGSHTHDKSVYEWPNIERHSTSA